MNSFIKKYLVLPVACALSLLYSTNSLAASKGSNIDPAIYNGVPFKMQKVVQPSFPVYTANILDFGAKGDGIFLNTKAINDAIKKVNAKGGGTVVIPSGLWLTGPIELLSNVNLCAEQNALVVFTDDYNAYPIIKTSFEGLKTSRC